MKKELSWEGEVSLATHIIIDKLIKSETGYFAIDLVDETQIPRDVFDEVISRLIAEERVVVVNHRLTVTPEEALAFTPTPILSWNEMMTGYK